MKYLRGILLPALLALAPYAVAKDEPAVNTREFDSELFNIFYFDDSDVVIAAELLSYKVYRSKDAGKSWDEVKDLRTLGLMKNPFDNKVAVALGDQKHWITYDQGENWQAFETEYGPSGSSPISFHAKDNKKLLYHTSEECYTMPCLGQVGRHRRHPRPVANIISRLSSPQTVSNRSQSPSLTAAKCACGPRAPNASSWTTTSTMIGYCV